MNPWPADKIERRSIDRLIPFARNARTHSPEQIARICASIREWGWTSPVLIDEEGTIIAGHGRVLAARQLGIMEVPVMVASDWSPAQKRAYVIADNKLAESAGWDEDLLRLELADLDALSFDLPKIGFEDAELEELLAPGLNAGLTDPDDVPGVEEWATTSPGDLWILGGHRLLCGDSTAPSDVAKVLGPVRPHLMVTDPPYGARHHGRDHRSGGRGGGGNEGITGRVDRDPQQHHRLLRSL